MVEVLARHVDKVLHLQQLLYLQVTNLNKNCLSCAVSSNRQAVRPGDQVSRLIQGCEIRSKLCLTLRSMTVTVHFVVALVCEMLVDHLLLPSSCSCNSLRSLASQQNQLQNRPSHTVSSSFDNETGLLCLLSWCSLERPQLGNFCPSKCLFTILYTFPWVASRDTDFI